MHPKNLETIQTLLSSKRQDVAYYNEKGKPFILTPISRILIEKRLFVILKGKKPIDEEFTIFVFEIKKQNDNLSMELIEDRMEDIVTNKYDIYKLFKKVDENSEDLETLNLTGDQFKKYCTRTRVGFGFHAGHPCNNARAPIYDYHDDEVEESKPYHEEE